MTPTHFPGANIVFATHQPQYLPLPAYKSPVDGRVLTCWKLTWGERIRILLGAKLWLTQLTFNQPLQPLHPEVDRRSPR